MCNMCKSKAMAKRKRIRGAGGGAVSIQDLMAVGAGAVAGNFIDKPLSKVKIFSDNPNLVGVAKVGLGYMITQKSSDRNAVMFGTGLATAGLSDIVNKVAGIKGTPASVKGAFNTRQIGSGAVPAIELFEDDPEVDGFDDYEAVSGAAPDSHLVG